MSKGDTGEIYELLDAIRQRPAMYISPSDSITALYNFLSGHLFLGNQKSLKSSRSLFYEFGNWVAMKCGFYESTLGWRNMLLRSNDNDETKAFHSFFDLLEEFKSRKATLLYSAKLPYQKNRKTRKIQIVKYTDDGGVFVRFLNLRGTILDEMYWQKIEDAFFITENQVGKLDWQPLQN